MSDITITLKDGVKLTGEPNQVYELAKKLGHSSDLDGKFYFSESKKEYVEIATMPVPHARNAFVKKLIDNLENVKVASKTTSNEHFVDLYSDLAGHFVEDKVLVALLFRVKRAGNA